MKPPLQSFRRRATNELVQIQAHFHPIVQQDVILWDDIRIAFPGAAQVYYGTVLITQLRNSELQIIEPQCILYQPDKELEIVVGEEPYYSQPLPSRAHTMYPIYPLCNNIDKESIMVDTNWSANDTFPHRDASITHNISCLQFTNRVDQSESHITQLLSIDDNIDSSLYVDNATENTFQILNVSTEADVR
ncbi:hypothetical protein FBU30_004292 [Linnemannia zychae]|nr:hypothetical protein FBU30_004292 [Linnemannia zychae]